MNLGDIKNIHFVGIGGIGMSGIAEILSHAGVSVSGCDAKRSAATHENAAYRGCLGEPDPQMPDAGFSAFPELNAAPIGLRIRRPDDAFRAVLRFAFRNRCLFCVHPLREGCFFEDVSTDWFEAGCVGRERNRQDYGDQECAKS